jgi:2-phosphosulfolactate phosphatase
MSARKTSPSGEPPKPPAQRRRRMPLEVELLLTPSELPGRAVKGRTLVVIDVLRLCTTICYALENGAERVIPVDSIESATRLAASLDRRAMLLCGEREGERIEGFHLGNSPREYLSDQVAGKTLLITTSNGTRVMVGGEGAREIALAALVNVSAVASWLCEREGPVLMICSGNHGRFALEDAVAAGLLLQRMQALASRSLGLGDASHAALALAEAHQSDLGAMLAGCENGQHLARQGFEEDLEVCARLDALQHVPVVREGRILGTALRSGEGVP